ncbi:MAG: copper resistance protein CopC [Candidatus Udaeobacter sp.]
MQKQLVVIGLLSVIAAVVRVEAHAFLIRAEPKVGSKMNNAPTQVCVWFSETVQSDVSSIKVFDVNGKQVDNKDTHSDRASRTALCVSLISALTPGSYKVVWHVTSADTHVTNGNFRFQIVP